MLDERQDLWTRAMRLHREKGMERKATPDEFNIIRNRCQSFQLPVVEQMSRDIRAYPLFGAVAMWVEPVKGALVEDEPGVITIARMLIVQAEDGTPPTDIVEVEATLGLSSCLYSPDIAVPLEEVLRKVHDAKSAGLKVDRVRLVLRTKFWIGGAPVILVTEPDDNPENFMVWG